MTSSNGIVIIRALESRLNRPLSSEERSDINVPLGYIATEKILETINDKELSVDSLEEYLQHLRKDFFRSDSL